jgi:hypothetical protein
MRALGAALTAMFVAFGCAKEQERPRPVTCVGKCGFTPGLGSVSPEGGAGPDGQGGSGNEDDPVELTGNVLILNDELHFSSGALYTDRVALRTEDASGRNVTGAWNGSDPFSIANVKRSSVLWVLATPENGVFGDALPAVEPVRTNQPSSLGQVDVTLALVRASSIEQILDLASVPLTPDSGKAQVILLLKQRTSGPGEPPGAADVTVTAPSAEGVLYGASGGFSDVSTATDATGVAVLANVPGAAWPGALVNVEFTGARSSGARVPAVTGAVTLATLTP